MYMYIYIYISYAVSERNLHICIYIHTYIDTDTGTYVRVYYITQITYITNTVGSGQLRRFSDSLRPGRSGDRTLVGARFS